MIWRVSDGQQIIIWDDPWIPAGITQRPRTPRGAVLLSKVSELMDPATGSQDVQLIKEIFWEEDVELILAMPTWPDHEDIVAWHYDPKGQFSVKSAYHALADSEEQDRLFKWEKAPLVS